LRIPTIGTPRDRLGVVSHRRFDPYNRERVWGFVNTEEYYSTLVENMYRSERGVALRMDYDTADRMSWVSNTMGAEHPYIRLEC
jgi:hypothetical protein